MLLRGLVQAAWSPATVTCAFTCNLQLLANFTLISGQNLSNSSSRGSSDLKHPGLRCSAFLAPPTGWHLWSNLEPRSIPNLVPKYLAQTDPRMQSGPNQFRTTLRSSCHKAAPSLNLLCTTTAQGCHGNDTTNNLRTCTYIVSTLLVVDQGRRCAPTK